MNFKIAGKEDLEYCINKYNCMPVEMDNKDWIVVYERARVYFPGKEERKGRGKSQMGGGEGQAGR